MLFLLFMFCIVCFIAHQLIQSLGQKEDSQHPGQVIDGEYKIIENTDVVIDKEGLAKAEQEALTTITKDMNNNDKRILHELQANHAIDILQFVDGAKRAYEIILHAIAKHELEALQALLDPPTYEQVLQSIEQLRSSGMHEEFFFIGWQQVAISSVLVMNDHAKINMRFVSEQIKATQDQAGKTVAGNPKKVIVVCKDVSFTRQLKASETLWRASFDM